MHLHPVLAVAIRTRAHASAQGLQVHVGIAAAGVDTGEYRRGVRTVRGGHHPPRQRRCERAEHHVHDPLAGVGAARDRSGKHGVEKRAGLGRDLGDVQDPFVVGHLRVEQGLEAVAHARPGRVQGHVHVARHLRRSAPEVEVGMAAGNANSYPDRNRARVEPVAIHHVLELVDAIGNALDRVAHARFGAPDDLAEGLRDRFRAMDFRRPPGCASRRAGRPRSARSNRPGVLRAPARSAAAGRADPAAALPPGRA